PADRSDGKPAGVRKPKSTERPPGAPATQKQRSDKPAAPPTGSAVIAIDPAGMLAAQSRLAVRLVAGLQTEKPDAANLVVSPASLAMVMTLIDLGADARMKAALARTLAFVGDVPAAKPGPRAAENQKGRKGDRGRTAAASPPAPDLAGLRTIVSTLQSDKDLAEALSVANAIWIDPAAKPKDATLAAVTAAGGEVFREPLGTPAALAAINGWVREKTRGMIPAMLDRVPADPGLVAIDALYFKDRWRTAFAASRTRPAPFTRLDGSAVDVPMMAGTIEAAPMRSDDDVVAVELAYTNPRFALVLLTSKDKPRRAADFGAALRWLDGRDFAPAAVDLSLPRIKLEERAELLPVLDALGLKEARMSPTALEGFGPGQRIADVIQKTVLTIDEAGTEAAAATAVVTVRSAIRTQNVRVAFDRPFWFALRDRDTGMVLLAGYVGDPGRAMATAAAAPEPPPAA
ncbi:serpin family protein, partial [Rhodoplanes roseus]